MKRTVIIFCVVLCAQLATAQQLTYVTGSVKDEKGNPVPYAFVRDRPYKYATYADSVGNFRLNVASDSYLDVKAPGYAGARAKVGGNTDFQLVLQSTGSADVSGTAKTGETKIITGHSTADNDNQNFSYGDGAIFSAPKKEDAHGSRYQFEDWVHGFFINPSDSLAQNPAYFYNYDKMGGGLLITQDKNKAVQVDAALLKSFTLVDNSGNAHTFARVSAIDNNHYVEVLASGKNYGIYKYTKTHFVRANYSSNGIASSGNNYDEFMDENIYYVLDVQTNQMQKITLKKKVLKTIFTKDPNKLNKFMDDHSSEDIDDAYLTRLGDDLNN
jgi:hypothetical protein